jgi:hypothetical protein
MSKRLGQNARRKASRSKHLLREEWGDEKDEIPPEPDYRDDDLPGSIFAVPDRHWGFESLGREDHPGVCTGRSAEAMQATLVKGRDAATDRGPEPTRFLVEPSRLNGLRKRTSFELVPRRQPLRRVRLLFANRRMGALEPELFTSLRQRLAILFPSEG